MRINLFSIITIIFISNIYTSFSQWAILRTDADSLIRLGAFYTYNVQFELAENCFKKVQKLYPYHPAGFFLDAMVDWWRIQLYRNLDKYDEQFLRKIDKVISLCERILDTNEFDINSLFFKAGAIGFRGRYYALRENWVPAATDGKIGFDLFIRCLKLAPTNHDIMLGTGIFNYFSIAIPEQYPFLKPILTFLPTGDKQLGILQLKAASRQARYANIEAKVVLLQIYYGFEKNYQEAFNIASELFSSFPNNPYFHRYLGRCYVVLGNLDKWEETWRQILLRYIDHQPGYDAMTAREALYYIGYALMNRGKYELAIKYLTKCDEASRSLDKETTGFRVNANLKLVAIYDILNNANKVIERCNILLSLSDNSNSHETARKFLSKYKKN